MDANRDCNGVRIEKRDLALLEDLFWQRLMSTGQIRRLGYFASQSRCNRRIRQLERHGYVVALPNSTDIVGRERLFCITKQGRHLLLTNGMIDVEDAAAFRKPPSQMMARHFAFITETRCRLHELGVLERWLPETKCRHTYSFGAKDRVFKPDAFALIRSGRSSQVIFIEADLGNASRSQIELKIRTYENYLVEVFADVYALTSFKVQFITTTAHRIDQLRRFVGKPLVPIEFTTLDELEKAVR